MSIEQFSKSHGLSAFGVEHELISKRSKEGRPNLTHLKITSGIAGGAEKAAKNKGKMLGAGILGAGLATAAGGYAAANRDKKQDVKKAATEAPTSSDGAKYRASRLQRINPRSKTYVKEGTSLKRVGLPLAGDLVGATVGGAIGGKLAGAQGAEIGALAGGIGAGSLGLHRNIKSGDTVSINRKSGKKAKSKVGLPSMFGAGLNSY